MSVAHPIVSFVVPCYKLAHLLPECINSLLSQTYTDFEVLIMDDCSPDNTPQVARACMDSRVKHIRNAANLGHLRNYNKGICLSRGNYVWLISADDYLRTPYVLERYVDLLDRHRDIGYVFCPGFGVHDGVEGPLWGRYTKHWDRDRVIRGHDLLRRLLLSNFILAPSGMVRRECYERISLFDLNMPWAGDWYLWCLFAMHYDVGYFSEPMVCYRKHHDVSMTTQLFASKLNACGAEEISIAWTLLGKAQEAGHLRLVNHCLAGIAQTYGRTLAAEHYRNASSFLNFAKFEDSLCAHSTKDKERNWIRARVYADVANRCFWQGQRAPAREFYLMALKTNPCMVAVLVKCLLLCLGRHGDEARKTILAWR